MTAAATAIAPRVAYLLGRADDGLILGHRLSEWVGHGPILEEEMALANIGLDLIGQARALYARAAELEADGRDEDSYAYFRDAGQFRNLLLVELPNGDFAVTMVRLLFYAAFVEPFWRATTRSTDATLAAIAARSEKECAYHLRHAADWVIRLGDGTDESHRRAQDAVDLLFPYVDEMFFVDGAEAALTADGFAVDAAALRPGWQGAVAAVMAQAGLRLPAGGHAQRGGRAGRHTEHLGPLLAVMQSVARAHPGARW